MATVSGWYLGREFYLAIADNALLFDGKQFVKPSEARYVWLIQTDVAVFDSPGPLPVDEWQQRLSLTMENGFQCEIIGVGGPVIPGDDVVSIPDPNNGECLCGVTCLGTEVQFVVVNY